MYYGLQMDCNKAKLTLTEAYRIKCLSTILDNVLS